VGKEGGGCFSDKWAVSDFRRKGVVFSHKRMTRKCRKRKKQRRYAGKGEEERERRARNL